MLIRATHSAAPMICCIEQMGICYPIAKKSVSLKGPSSTLDMCFCGCHACHGCVSSSQGLCPGSPGQLCLPGPAGAPWLFFFSILSCYLMRLRIASNVIFSLSVWGQHKRSIHNFHLSFLITIVPTNNPRVQIANTCCPIPNSQRMIWKKTSWVDP